MQLGSGVIHAVTARCRTGAATAEILKVFL
jgi:hypothetical protein